MNKFTAILFTLLFFSINSSDAEQEAHTDKDNHASHIHTEGKPNIDNHKTTADTEVDSRIAKKLGIETALVSPKTLSQRISSYGSLTTSPEHLSHVTARFPGLITAVDVAIGDKVKKGVLLAKVESNDSLRSYSINSPIDGKVIQRHANTGEFTSSQVLFSIANFDTLWAELRVYPTQRPLVSAGQHVLFNTSNQTFEGEIAHIIPVVNQPYQLARVEVNNAKLGLSPGMLVEGHIVINQFSADKTVVNEAIQTLRGQQGVFIKKGDSYAFIALQLGRKDEHYTEVLSGISPEQQYVTSNSYLIKADIEKPEAEHQH